VIVATHGVHLLDRFPVRRIHIEQGRLASYPYVAA
jgi:ABC-type ATPase involved in cell division